MRPGPCRDCRRLVSVTPATVGYSYASRVSYANELRSLTEELESLTERERVIREARAVPDGTPIIAHPGDVEIEQLVADWEAHQDRYEAFLERHKPRRP